ncbi:MAG: PspC domain-containing protein [Vicinamibacterales bacterium]
MQKVITINLNGHAYQLDESGYEVLREYLARAERELEGNPDRAEIIADLEQAIADKCQRFLGPHKSVVTTREVEQIVGEMGPIDAAAGSDAGGGGEAGQRPAGTEAPPKRLHRIPEGAMIAGICTGVAAYFAIDVAIVRVGFVIAALVTQGAGIIAYVVMMFVLPEAKTGEQRAAAGAAPFNARDVMDRAKDQYTKGTRRLRRHWRQQQRQWRRQAAATHGAVVYGPPGPAIVLLPLFGVVHLALFLIMAATMISLVNTGQVLGWELDPDVPVWAAALILLVAYSIVVPPFRAMQYFYERPRAGQPAPYAFWHAAISLVAIAVIFWVASNNIPEIREFLQQVPDLFRDFTSALRDALTREG